MINNFVNKGFFYLYVFTLCFGVLLYNTTGFKGLDVVSSLLLVGLYLVFVIGTKNKHFHIGFLIVMIVFLFFLNYSFYIANNTLNAITIDFLTQLRPYVAFFLVLQISPTFTEKQKSILKKICFYLWLFYIPIGLLATINSSFLSTLMDQPANYIACITCLAVVHLFCGNFTVKDKLTFIFMLATGLITMHSRFYIFFLIVCGLVMYFHHADILKSNLKTGFALVSVAVLVIYISRMEIFNYLFSAHIAGGGFASLAGQASSGFYSQLNNSGFNPINGFMYQEWFTGSSSYYPVLAQLGLIGILLYLSFWVYIFATSIMQFKKKGDIQPFVIVFMLVVFIFLENITDSFFTSNKGYFMMMFIGLLMAKPEETDNMTLFQDKTITKKKRFAALQAIWFIRKKKATDSDKEITYMIPAVKKVKADERPAEKQVKTTEPPAVKIDTNQSVPITYDVVEQPHVQQETHPARMEVASLDVQQETLPVQMEVASHGIKQDTQVIQNNIEVNDTQSDSIVEPQLHGNVVDVSSETLYADADDEFDWEDDFEDYDEYDWEVELEKEIVVKASDTQNMIREEAKKEANFEESIFTYTPAITYTFNQTNEASIPANTGFIAARNSDDDFIEESYNYVI